MKVCRSLNIKNYALSFTSRQDDIKKFKALLPKQSRKIYKIETHDAIKNIEKLARSGDEFLIDRGDLSKDIGIFQVPYAQRKVIKKLKNKKNKKVFIATNFLETMINN